jgi:quercetin dioxygenase-like cupin family protein
MRITRKSADSQPGPSDWIAGPAWLEEIAVADAPSRLRIHSVHFAPGARTCWHRHPIGQVLIITAGSGLVQCKDGPIQQVRTGDTVWFEPDEWHWHGAGPGTFMTHLAVQETAPDGKEADRGDHVSDGEYPT